MKWSIYYGSREYARDHGDPLLGTVEAATKEEAEREALRLGMGVVAGVGVWASATQLLVGERIDFCGR